MADYPFLQPALATQTSGLPVYKDVKWDFDGHKPVFFGGNPVVVSGSEAVLSWAARALAAIRYTEEAYSWDYGCEAANLIGQPWSQETKRAEAERYIRECLLQLPYITGVINESVSFAGSTLTLTARIQTVYGTEEEVAVNV